MHSQKSSRRGEFRFGTSRIHWLMLPGKMSVAKPKTGWRHFTICAGTWAGQNRREQARIRAGCMALLGTKRVDQHRVDFQNRRLNTLCRAPVSPIVQSLDALASRQADGYRVPTDYSSRVLGGLVGRTLLAASCQFTKTTIRETKRHASCFGIVLPAIGDLQCTNNTNIP